VLERVSFVRLLCGSLLQLFFVSYRVSVALSRVSFVGLFFCCSGSLLQVSSCVGLFCRSFSRYMGLFSEIHMTQTRKEEEASSKLRWSLLCDLQVSFVGLFSDTWVSFQKYI